MHQHLTLLLTLLCALPAAAERLPLDECKAMAAKLNAEAPKEMSSHSRLESVKCVQGKSKPRLVYNNRVLVDVKKPSPKVIARMKQEQRHSWCSDGDQRGLLEMVDVSYAYYDKSRRYLGALTHRIDDCPK